MIDNYPVDVCREMGADVIIGIDVQSELKVAHELNSVTDVLFQIIDLTGLESYHKNLKSTNLYAKVNVNGFSSASFNPKAIDTLITIGEAAMRDKWEELLVLKENLNLEKDYTPN